MPCVYEVAPEGECLLKLKFSLLGLDSLVIPLIPFMPRTLLILQTSDYLCLLPYFIPILHNSITCPSARMSSRSKSECCLPPVSLHHLPFRLLFTYSKPGTNDHIERLRFRRSTNKITHPQHAWHSFANLLWTEKLGPAEARTVAGQLVFTSYLYIYEA